jgi:DNA polymerase I-like protein with 3'-5' exonuclease and polymerase domains
MARDRKDKSTIAFFERIDLGEKLEQDWNIPAEYPDLTKYPQIAIDLETCDPHLTTLGPGWARKDGFIVGIAVAAGDQAWYFPIRHQNGHNLDPKMTLKWFAKQMATPHIDKIMHNATYDAGWLRAEGVNVQGRIIDTMVAAPLIDENRFSYSLNNLGRDYIDMRKDEKMLRAAAKDWGIDPKADMWRLPASYVGAYAEQDAFMTLKLWDRLKTEISGQDLTHIFQLETSLIPLMIDMRARGVRVDLDKAEIARKGLRIKVQELKAEIKRKTGVDIEPWASASVLKVFDVLNLQYPRTPEVVDDEGTVLSGGAPSFTKQYLNAHPHEVCQMIVQLREFDKADSTFIDSILRYETKGRIHTEFHQLRSDDGGTVTGRFSSSNPNLQQIPARDPDIKRLIRGLFVPEEGESWGSFDYSSQEPRLLVHFAASMPDHMRSPVVDTIVDEYHKGDVDLHQMVADIAGISRKQAKAVNLGIMYGMGVTKLAAQLDVSVEEAKRIMGEHKEKVPFVKQLADVASKRAEKQGQIRTVLGRLCRFHLWEPTTFGYNQPLSLEKAKEKYGNINNLKRAFSYKALNKLIQGSAADQTKKAMADCYAEGLVPLLTVHDELCFSVSGPEQAARIKEIMENGLPLKIPSRVDDDVPAFRGLPNNWGEVE